MRDLHAGLKRETAVIHRRLETAAFFQALHAHTLPKLAIVSFLRTLAIIHAVLERALADASNDNIAALCRHTTTKVPLLVADLEALDAELLPSIAPAVQIALEYASELLVDAEDPLSLVGALYVLEGSQNGAALLQRAYARCLQVPEPSLSYFGCYGEETSQYWAAFADALNDLDLDTASETVVAGSAVRCFERLEQICLVLYPYTDQDVQFHVAGINFEAGDHTMPHSPLEVALALRCGRNAWSAYPYLAHRFGERGKRFTSSDSCWLVALSRTPAAIATKNLQWLRTVLASRGIPTVILETHLRAIAAALTAEYPDQPDLCTRFDMFLSARAVERHTLTDVSAVSSLVAQFDRQLKTCGGLIIASTAELMTSAWVDERAGIRGALRATQEWFVDPARFSNDWISTINDLVRELDRAGVTTC